MSTNNYLGAIPSAIAPGPGKSSSIFARETGHGSRRRTVLEFHDHLITGADEAGVVGKFVEKVYTLPQGRIWFEGASANLSLLRVNAAATGGVNANWDGDFGLGTDAASAATLDGTEQDLIVTGAITQAVAGAASVAAGSTSVSTSSGAGRILDGVSSAVDVYLNILVDDADQDMTTGGASMKVNGEIVIHWTYLGDK